MATDKAAQLGNGNGRIKNPDKQDVHQVANKKPQEYFFSDPP